MFAQEELAVGKGHKGKLQVPHVRMVCEKLRAEHSNRAGAGEEGGGDGSSRVHCREQTCWGYFNRKGFHLGNRVLTTSLEGLWRRPQDMVGPTLSQP